MRSASESDEQKIVVEWARRLEGAFPALGMLFCVPNGGLRSVRTAARLKAEGVRAGVSDLVLPVPKDGWAGVFLELKTAVRARQGLRACSDDQVTWLRLAATYDWKAVIAFGADAARVALAHYLRIPGDSVGVDVLAFNGMRTTGGIEVWAPK